MSTITQHAHPAADLAAAPHDRNPLRLSGGRLTGTEWEIVEMASWDGPRSLNPGGWLARIETVIFGDVALPLANVRLESLRRFAVKAWFWNRLGERDIAAILEAGFAPDNVRQILDHVASRRGFAPRVEAWPS